MKKLNQMQKKGYFPSKAAYMEKTVKGHMAAADFWLICIIHSCIMLEKKVVENVTGNFSKPRMISTLTVSQP